MSGAGGKVLAWLGRALRERPFAANAALSGTILVLGDMAAQAIERRSEAAPKAEGAAFDKKRLASMALWGSAMAAPTVMWFRWLDRVFPPAVKSPRAILTKVLFNQVTMAPAMNALFFGYVLAVDRTPAPVSQIARETLPAWKAKVQKDLVPVTARSLMWWAPVHIINFTFVPPHARAVYTSCGLVVWTTYLSIVGHANEPGTADASAATPRVAAGGAPAVAAGGH